MLSSLSAQLRANQTSRAYRRAGLLPGVMYGKNFTPVSIVMDPRPLLKEIEKGRFYNRIIELDVDGKKQHVLPRAIQLHPIYDRPMHIDFMCVDMDQTIDVKVPLVLINEDKCVGLKRGGVLNAILHEVILRCPVSHIPESVIIDLQDFDIHHSVHVGDLQLPQDVKALMDSHETVVTILAPTQAEEPAQA